MVCVESLGSLVLLLVSLTYTLTVALPMQFAAVCHLELVFQDHSSLHQTVHDKNYLLDKCTYPNNIYDISWMYIQ